jgi:hypothetical protein
MVISDRAYAAQLYAEALHRHVKFDDAGCMINWLNEQSMQAPAHLWVADSGAGGAVHWLDARSAHYVPGHKTPMDYGFGAVVRPEPGALTFAQARQAMLQRNRNR